MTEMCIITMSHFFQDGGGNFNGREQFLSSSSTLTINVIDAQDTPPIFVGTPYFGYVYEISVPVITCLISKIFVKFQSNFYTQDLKSNRFSNICGSL